MQQPPPSISNNYINFTGLAASIIAFLFCQHLHVDTLVTAFILCISFTVTVLLLEVIFLKSHKRPSTGLDWNKHEYNARRVAIKCLGLYGTFAALGIIYYISPEYHAVYYRPFWEAVRFTLPALLMLSVPYIAFVDARMKEPQDGLYQFGLCLLGRWQETEYKDVMQYVLGWIVKGFFLPLMWGALNDDIIDFQNLSAFSNYNEIFSSIIVSLFLMDVMLGSIGYVLTLRIADTHIRNADNSMFGWAVCIICYLPFIWMLQGEGMDYKTYPWVNIHPVLQILWGNCILLLAIINVLHTAQFGCRFSNLTNRGIITNGLYRFTKHPAYVAKNLAWWLIAFPFAYYDTWQENIFYTLFLLAVNSIYFMRARAEERHLSSDPNYVAYALWMNEHSIFRGITRAFPWLKYSCAAK